MEIEFKTVKSSHVAEMGHDGDTLAVRYKSGAVYHYPGISADRFKEISGSMSIGKALGSLKTSGKLIK